MRSLLFKCTSRLDETGNSVPVVLDVDIYFLISTSNTKFAGTGRISYIPVWKINLTCSLPQKFNSTVSALGLTAMSTSTLHVTYVIAFFFFLESLASFPIIPRCHSPLHHHLFPCYLISQSLFYYFLIPVLSFPNPPSLRNIPFIPSIVLPYFFTQTQTNTKSFSHPLVCPSTQTSLSLILVFP